MSKKERKISILDYLILLLIGAFFCIVYFYSSIIWPREEKFKSVDRSRMERIDDAQKLYYSLTNDYNEDGRVLFSMMEAIKDTLNGDAFFEGEKKIVLAKKNKKELYLEKSEYMLKQFAKHEFPKEPELRLNTIVDGVYQDHIGEIKDELFKRMQLVNS